MTDLGLTEYKIKIEILAELWMNSREDEEFEKFFSYNDLGLPLAYALREGIVPSTGKASNFINETFASLLSTLEIEDEGFDDLDEVLDFAEGSKNILE